MSGIVVLSQMKIFDNGGNGGPTPPPTTNIIDTTGGFKKDLSAFPYLVGTKISFIYIGGEFCPYCGVERWAIVMALSELGTFSNLDTLVTSEASIPTYTFVGSSYSSQTVDFQPVEIYDNQQHNLESMTTTQKSLYNSYGTGSIPFMVIGGTTFKSGAGNSLNVNSFSGVSFSTVKSQVDAKSGALYDQIKTESDNILNIIASFQTTTSSSAMNSTSALMSYN